MWFNRLYDNNMRFLELEDQSFQERIDGERVTGVEDTLPEREELEVLRDLHQEFVNSLESELEDDDTGSGEEDILDGFDKF